MVGRRKRLGKRAEVRFAVPPWNEESEEWQALDAELPADHPAREVMQGMKLLDLTALFASYTASGSPPLRPDLMLAIVLIEMRQGRHRPSQWFRDSQENLALRWAGFGIHPSRTCWYNFAQRMAPFVEGWNATAVRRAVDQGVTAGERVALDGSVVAANASRHRLVNEPRLQQRQGELDTACLRDAQGQPLEETPSWMAKTPATRLLQQRRYQKARERLQELHAINDRQQQNRRRKREKIVVSPSDPEAALGRDKQHVFRPLYNVQLVCDVDSPLVLAYEVFAQATDAGTFAPMLQRTAEITGSPPRIILVDATYVTASNLAFCVQGGCVLYGPWQENDYSAKKPKPGKKAPMLRKDRFFWLPELQMYRCPQGHLLKWIGKQRRHEADGQVHTLHRYRCSPEDCRVCPIGRTCTSNPNRGRSVKRSEHEELINAHRARMATEEGKRLYKLRRQTVELGFADLKEHRALRRFSGRGRLLARTQVGLAVLVHNLPQVTRSPPSSKNTTEGTPTPVEICT